jgi:4'-phosphopantetheinyl transferase
VNDQSWSAPDDATTVDVFVLSLRVSASDLPRVLAVLDDAEREAAGERVGDARRQYAVAHAAVRVLLARHLDTDPKHLAIRTEPNGRPRVDGVAFSLSHSVDRGVVAIAPHTVNVGVDIERVIARPHLDRLAQRAFGPDEYELWRALAPRSRPRRFAQRWTEIEALLKARGVGIARSGLDGGIAAAHELDAGWGRTTFDAGAGYVGAVAADVSSIAVATHGFRLHDTLRGRDGTAH